MNQSSIQISLRLPPEWHQALENLADAWSDKFGKEYTVQDLVRKSVEMSFELFSNMAQKKD